MAAFAAFEGHLRDMLTHLYDPAYQPPELLWKVLGGDPQQGAKAIQAAIIRAIEDLEPAPDAPPTARSRRIYELLSYRYVQDLTQERAAKRLGITPRHLRREQREAIQILARRLWEEGRMAIQHKVVAAAEAAPEGERRSTQATRADTPSLAWRSQVRQELAALQKSAPGTMSDVGETIRGSVELQSALTSKQGVQLDIEHIQPHLYAAIHPSALRQVLITAIRELVQHVPPSGQVTLRAERQEKQAQITIAGHPAVADSPPDGDLIREIVAAQGGSAEIGIGEEYISFCIELPSVDKATVLVVDDNRDLVHFYKRYTAGTRYHIVHVAQGQSAFEAIEAFAPALIVLDVMLPDVDGWELLVRLHEHPASRAIPIVVCSVIRERDLALALGAALYLPKPVRRQEFIQALDLALHQAATRTTTVPANNAATG
jgi:CheY-like chemotaxis protein